MAQGTSALGPLDFNWTDEDELLSCLVIAQAAPHPDPGLIAARKKVLELFDANMKQPSDAAHTAYLKALQYADTLDDAIAGVDTAKRKRLSTATIAKAQAHLDQVRAEQPA